MYNAIAKRDKVNTLEKNSSIIVDIEKTQYVLTEEF